MNGNQITMAAEKKRSITPLELIMLVIALFIILSIGLQKCGVKVYRQQEDTEIIHKPHQD